MSRTVRNRRTTALLAGALVGAMALAGCGAGQVAQTAYQTNNSGGASGQVGAVQVLDARIEAGEEIEAASAFARGGEAPLEMRIVNTGAAADRLVSITSPVASSVLLSGSTDVIPGVPLVIEGVPAATGAAVPTGEPGPSGVPATPLPAAPEPVAERGVAQAVLTGLREDVRSGLTYQLVLTFEKAGEVRVEVPVNNPTAPREEHQEHEAAE